MKTKYILSVMAIVAITKTSYAQYSQDAIRLSGAQPGSTARIKAIGNATTAVGGDMSAISGNPAGLGFFTKSELSITPELNQYGAKTGYLGTTSNSNSSTLNFNNASIVLYSKLNSPKGANKEEGWLSFNVGASYNRTNDFYQTISYNGTNTNNSISNYFADLGNRDGVDAAHAYYIQDYANVQYLIDSYNTIPATTPATSSFLSNVFNTGHGAPNQPVTQGNTITREGGQTEFSFSAGANYSNKLYLGFGFGITSVRYNSINTFTESGTASVFNGTTTGNSAYTTAYTQNQATTGSGFNARFGVIYKPEPSVRLGATITTPTWYTMDDDYGESLRTQIKSVAPGNYFNGPNDFTLTYNFHTPLKISGGAAVFLGNAGFLTGDIEYLDYTSVKIQDADGYKAANDNRDIKNLYRSTVNYHLGAEFKVMQLAIRGGYGVQATPLRTNGTDVKTASGGLGYRFMNYYIDATYANVQGNQNVLPYLVSSNNPQANVANTYNNVFLTLGLRF